jgi:hypothetical protein
MDDIMIIQDYIPYYGEQVINMVGMYEMDDIFELTLLLPNEHLYMQWQIEKLLMQKMISWNEI